MSFLWCRVIQVNIDAHKNEHRWLLGLERHTTASPKNGSAASQVTAGQDCARVFRSRQAAKNIDDWTVTRFYPASEAAPRASEPGRYAREVRATPAGSVTREFIGWTLATEPAERAAQYVDHMCAEQLVAHRSLVIEAVHSLMRVSDLAARPRLEQWTSDFCRRHAIVWRGDGAKNNETRAYSMCADGGGGGGRIVPRDRERECSPTLLFRQWQNGWVAAPRLLRMATLLLRFGYTPQDLCWGAFRNGRCPWTRWTSTLECHETNGGGGGGDGDGGDRIGTGDTIIPGDAAENGSCNGDIEDEVGVSLLAALLSTGKIKASALTVAHSAPEKAASSSSSSSSSSLLPPAVPPAAAMSAPRPLPPPPPPPSSDELRYGIDGVENVDSRLIAAARRLVAAQNFVHRLLEASPQNVPTPVGAIVCEYAYDFFAVGAPKTEAGVVEPRR